MSENASKLHDLIKGLLWLMSPEGQQVSRERLRGTHRVNMDPEHPGRAWLTYLDETVVHGRLLVNGEFIPDKTGDASGEAGQ